MKNLLLVVLAVSAYGADLTPAPPANSACGPTQAKFNVKAVDGQPLAPQPESGKALIYVVEQYDRPSNELGKPTVRVGLDGTWTGANRGASYLFFSVPAGEHHFCADWQAPPSWIGPKVSLTSLTAEPGQTYYLRARVIEHNLSTWTLDLERVNPDEGRWLVQSSPLSDYQLKK
jgi:hypothetical protein